MTAPVPPVPDEPGPAGDRAVCDHFYVSHCYRGMSIRICSFCHQPDWDDLERQLNAPRSPETPAGVSTPGDSGRAFSGAHAQAQQRAGAVPALPPGAVFDREAVREIARMAIGRYWNHDPLGCDDHPAAERVTEAVWPLLEHAQQALSSNEGIRLWMLDCGELVTRHRERAERAEATLEAAVPALNEILRDVASDETARAALRLGRVLGIIGSEEAGHA